MSTRNLIDAIEAGDSLQIENAFNSIMADKVSDTINTMRSDIAQTMFATEETIDDDEEFEQLEEVTTRQVKDFHDVLGKHADVVPAVKKFNADAGNKRKFNKAHDAIVQHDIAATKYDRKYRDMKKEEYDEEELTLEDYSLEELEEYMMSEEFEQLDELSKDTLGSYVKKAASDVNTKSRDAQQHKDMFAGDYPVRGAKKQAQQNQADINKRVGGIGKAVDKMTK